MYFDVNRLSGLLLIFFVHGLVYAGLLLKRGVQTDTASDKWLSFFLLLSVLYICPYMLGFAGWYNGNECLECRNFLFYMPLQHALLMGPVIYFYTQSLLNPGFKFTKKQLFHFAPGILYVVWTIIVAVVDRLILKKYYLMDGQNDPDFDDWYVVLGLVSFLIYLIKSITYYTNYRKFIVQELSFADSLQFKWIGNFLIGCLIYFFSTLIMYLLYLLGINLLYSQTWWYYMLFAIVFYYIAISGYSFSIETKKSFQLDFLKYQMPGLLAAPEITTEDASFELIEQTKEQKQDQADYEGWQLKILNAVKDEEMFKDPELTLTDLAKHLGTNSSVLSKIINRAFQMNFNDFINRYRVEEVKKQLQNPKNASLTIMSLAYDAGFNSKATFNRAFKKHTGENPSKYQIVNN
ncbi:MAG: helix-turn-helix domain-containing protein [Sediminibacterium sp.]|nr:helix-turn-helix transcriptional regulator [Sediminibacterium sp.]